jgi:hypothetical protein
MGAGASTENLTDEQYTAAVEELFKKIEEMKSNIAYDNNHPA